MARPTAGGPDRRRPAFWLLTALVVLGGIELGALAIERIENAHARRRNPFVEAVNPAPAFRVDEEGGRKVVSRSGFHPLMHTELPPFPLERPPGGLRVFVLGGSAAGGWPYHVGDTSISALLERKLRRLLPGRSVEVVNAAAGTYASHRVALVLEEILRYGPDAVFVYNGNNELLESLVYRPRSPPAPLDRSAALRVGYRALKALTTPLPRIDVRNYDITAQVPNTLSFAFSRASLYREDPRQFRELLDHYRFNMEGMVSAAAAARIPLFLLTCPVNLKDWVPNVSRHRRDLTPAERARWTALFREGFLAVERGAFAEALAPLRAAVALDAEHAEAHFHLAEALRRTGRVDEARAEYLLALERDAFPFRELPEFQAILREVAARRGVPLVDIIPPLEAVAGDGIIGLDVLVDYVHLTERSQEIVAHEMARALQARGLLPGVSAAEVERARVEIQPRFWARRDAIAADLNYSMAMIMHQDRRLDALYAETVATLERAAREDPAIAEDSRRRIGLFRVVHSIASAYRDLRRAEKLGLLEETYTPEEAQRIFAMYREMIYQSKASTLSREEFQRRVPEAPFANGR